MFFPSLTVNSTEFSTDNFSKRTRKTAGQFFNGGSFIVKCKSREPFIERKDPSTQMEIFKMLARAGIHATCTLTC